MKSRLVGLCRTVRLLNGHPLAKGRRLKTWFRFLRWQLSSRLAVGPTLVPWLDGAYLLVGRGDTGLTGNIYVTLHEYDEMSFLLHFLKPGDLFVDIGANLGSYTVLAGAVVGAEVVAFEPSPRAFEGLIRNVALNRIGDHVDTRNVGLAAEAGLTLSFSASGGPCGHILSKDEHDPDPIRIATSTLDLELAGRQAALIKLDVEGYELAVLRGATASLRAPTLLAVMVELNGSGSRYEFSQRELLDLLALHDFLPYSYEPALRALRKYASGGTLTGENTIFVRDLPSVVARLETGVGYSAGGLTL